MAGIVAKNDRTKLFLREAGAGAFALDDKIGNMTNIGDISSTDEEIDVTTLEQDVRDFENGFSDSGSIEITQNLTQDEFDIMSEYKENETDLKVGVAIINKAGMQVIGIQCAKAKIMTVTLGGMSVGGVLTVVTSIRIKSKFTRDFVAPGGSITPVASITVNGASTVSIADIDGENYTVSVTPVGATTKAVKWTLANDDGEASIESSTATVCVLSGAQEGTVTLRATAKDGSGVFGEKEIKVVA